MDKRFTRITLAVLCLSLANTVATAQESKPATPPVATEAAVATAPADHPFSKVKPGMSFNEAVEILGKPTAENAYCTGKHRIPFYSGSDKAYTEYLYKGQGKVYFYTRITTFSMFHGAVNSCTPKEPYELATVEYNPNETGVVAKEGAEVKKEPAEAAK